MEFYPLRAKMRALWRPTIAAISVVALLPAAEAAQVTPIKGEVLVNTGAGYQRAEAAMELSPGDSAIAKPNAQASLRYPDGCVVDVVPGMVAWVERVSPCAATSRSTADPAPALAAPRTFDPAWLLGDGAIGLRRRYEEGS